MSSDDTCGSTDTDTGEPCQRTAGWGTDRDTGPCRTHEPGGEEPGGRPREPPSKAIQEQIASVIEGGGSIQEACRKAEIHRERFYRWMEYGHDEDAGPFQEFRDRLVRAQGEGEGQYRQALLDIARENGDTATLMAMLKQRYPGPWGDVDRGQQTSGVVVDLGGEDEYEIDPETLEVKNQKEDE